MYGIPHFKCVLEVRQTTLKKYNSDHQQKNNNQKSNFFIIGEKMKNLFKF